MLTFSLVVICSHHHLHGVQDKFDCCSVEIVALGIVTSFIFCLKFHFVAKLLSSCIILYQSMCCVGSVVDVEGQ